MLPEEKNWTERYVTSESQLLFSLIKMQNHHFRCLSSFSEFFSRQILILPTWCVASGCITDSQPSNATCSDFDRNLSSAVGNHLCLFIVHLCKSPHLLFSECSQCVRFFQCWTSTFFIGSRRKSPLKTIATPKLESSLYSVPHLQWLLNKDCSHLHYMASKTVYNTQNSWVSKG